MAKRDKRIEAMRRNSRNVRPDELDVVLVSLGFAVEHDSTSHKIYRCSGRQIPVPQHRPFLKSVYVKKALAMIDELGLLEE